MLITKNIYFDWQINPGLITMKQEPSFLYTTEMYDDEGFLAAPPHPDKLPVAGMVGFWKAYAL